MLPGVKTHKIWEAVERAVEVGLAGAAVVDYLSNTVAVAGTLAAGDVRPIMGDARCRLVSEGTMRRMLGGEMIQVSLDDRTVAIGIAAQFLFVIVAFAEVTKATRALASALRRDVERLIDETQTDAGNAPPWTRGGGGSSSGPANVPVIEIGVTIPFPERAKA
jgi:hypothetical protein